MGSPPTLPKQWPFVACIALVLVGYARAPFGGFVWDDGHLILQDARLRTWTSFVDVITSSFWAGSSLEINEFYSAIYRPVVSAAYLFEMQIFGINPVGFHIVSIVLHVACTLLCIRWLADRLPGAPPLALFVGGMLFAIHPSRVETVAWVSGCVDLWAAFWILLGLEAWRSGRASLSGLLFALALFSKEIAVMAPLLLLTDHILLKREQGFGRRWTVVVASMGAALALRIWLVPLSGAARLSWPEMPERVLSTLGHLVRRIVFPWPQTVHPALRLHDASGSEVFAPWAIALGTATSLCIGVLVLLAWKREQRYAGWLADALWLLVPLLPTLNIVDIDAITRASDRFLYWPFMGVSALSCRAAAVAMRRRQGRRIVAVASTALALAFVSASIVHVGHFRSNYALWAHEYEVDRTNTEALWALTALAKDKGLAQSAHRLCSEGLHAAETRRYRWTMIRFALCQLETALEMASEGDRDTVTYVASVYDRLMEQSVLSADRGTLQFELPISSEAIRAQLMADPSHVALPRARAHLLSGHTEDGIAQLEQITRSYPTSTKAWHMLIAAYQTEGDQERARMVAAHAGRLFGPDFAQ